MITRSERWFERLVALVAFTILLQTLLAVVFTGDHNTTDYLSLGLALATVLLATLRLRVSRPVLWRGALVLFGLDLVQTAIARLVTAQHGAVLIAVRVPVTMALFGLALGLTLSAERPPVRPERRTFS